MDHLIGWGLGFMLAAAGPVAGQDRINLGGIGGVIQDVTGTGRLVFEGGSSAALWGLQVTNLAAAQDLLIGRTASCVVVTQTETGVTADCTIGPKSRGMGGGLDWINLLVWLPEFGIARLICNANDATKEGQTHPNAKFYLCRAGKVPKRNGLSYPTGPTGLY